MVEALLNDGWAYHDTDGMRLAGELERAAEAPIAPKFLLAFLQLSNHTVGEHLSDWPRAKSLAERVLGGHTPTAETCPAWGRLYVARFLSGDLAGAAEAERIYLNTTRDAHAADGEMRLLLAGAMIGSKRLADGARVYRDALEFVRSHGSPGTMARGTAMVSNNIACDLLELPTRTRDDDALMELASRAAHEFWLRCGDWVNEELALTLSARVAFALNEPLQALEQADAALAVIGAHGRRPFDAAVLHLLRARSFTALADSESRERALVSADLAASDISVEELKVRFTNERRAIR